MKILKKISYHFFKNHWPLILLVGLVCSFFWKFFLRGQIPFPGDFVVGVYYPWLDYKWGYAVGVPVKNPIMADVPSFIFPMQTLAINLIKSAKAPLWNPAILAGTPLLANFQSAPFSPVNFLYFIFDTLTAWSFQIIFQHILCALFTYILLRHWKVSRFGSFVGGLIFAFSGFNLIWSQWNGHALTAALIPLFVLFQDKFFNKGKVVYGAAIALTLSFQIFSGYPQVVIYTALASIILWTVRLKKDKDWLHKTLFFGFFCTLGLGLSAIQLLPGAELLRLSQWTAETNTKAWAFLPRIKTITFLAPDYFGNHVTRNYWGPQDYTSNTGFSGVVAFILAGLSLSLVKKKKEILFSLLLLIATLAISYPTPVSIFFWKYNLFGMRTSSSHRALVLLNLSIALLAGFGIDALQKSKANLKEALTFPYLIIGATWIATLYFWFTTKGALKYFVGVRNLIFPTAILFSSTALIWIILRFKALKKPANSLLLALLVFELFRFGWKFTPFSPRALVFPKTPVLEFLTSQEKPFRTTNSRVIPVNLHMFYNLESLEGYETMRPYISSKFIAALNQGTPTASPTGRYGIIDNDTSHLLDLANTKYYLALKKDKKGRESPTGVINKKYDPKRFTIAFEDKSVVVLESNSVLPRAFMVYDWEVGGNEESILKTLLDPSFPISKKIILQKNPSIKKPVNDNLQNEVKYLKYDRQKSIIEVATNSPGLLFISDTFFPGWKAFVDNKETEILNANFTFRAIEIPEGKHIVSMAYEPKSFSLGIIVSFISLILLTTTVILKQK